MAIKLALRDYQQECITKVWGSWAGRSGLQRPAVVLPTGAGKTVIFSHLSRDYIDAHKAIGDPWRVVILVHRDELADQTIAKVRAVAPDLTVGKVKAADDDVHADVMVCSVQTLARENRLDRLIRAQQTYGPVGLVIVDECFPAGTPVGGVPIEKLQPGDMVPTWNEETGREELRPVLRVMRKAPSAMVRVTLADGSSFACTPNHPILTSGGWCPAGALPRGASVVSFTHDANADRNNMHGVRGTRDAGGEGPGRQLSEERPNVLLDDLPGRLGAPGLLAADGPDQPPVRLGADGPEQPHAPAGEPGEDAPHPGGDRAQAAAAGRERFGSDGAAAQACGIPGLADGGGGHSWGRGTPLPLQGGYSPPVDEGAGGGGRGIPLLAGPPSLRPEEGRTAVLTRVDDIQVLEPGGDGTYGGVCPDGAVYNIEVDTTHTYLIGDGVVVHNCHHAAAPTYQTVLRKLGCFDRVVDGYDQWQGTRAVGFTATLKRGDDVGLGDTWQEVVYTRPLLWMIGKGYLTDVRGVTIQTSVDLGGVKKSGGDYQAKDLGRALMEHEVPAQTAQVIEEYCAQRRPIVFMPDVATAHATVDALERRGISAAAVDGTTGRETRLAIYEQFRRGRIRVLVNCMVLTEGADFPWADCVVVARPTRNEALYIQMVGRGLRPWDGKDDCLVINMAGAGGRLSTLIDLEPGAVDEVRPDETLGEAAVRYAEEQDAVAFDSDNPAFLLRHRDVDLFTASKHAWLRTDGGVMFVPFTGYYFPGAEHGNDRARHGNGYVLLWPEDGTWTVAMAPERGRWHRLHTGLTLGMAQAWAETEAEERNSFNGQKKAGWRRDKPSGPQQRFARGLGINPEGMSRGELSDEISRVQATRLLDPFMRSQEAS